jgi:hypothetical protein
MTKSHRFEVRRMTFPRSRVGDVITHPTEPDDAEEVIALARRVLKARGTDHKGLMVRVTVRGRHIDYPL